MKWISIILLVSLISSSPDRKSDEVLYIVFNGNTDKCFIKKDSSKVFHLYPKIDNDFFTHNPKKHKIKKVDYASVKKNLISKDSTNKFTKTLIENEAKTFEQKTNFKGNTIRNPPYNFNRYYKMIYIYVKTNDEEGVLYEVDWNYAIE